MSTLPDPDTNPAGYLGGVARLMRKRAQLARSGNPWLVDPDAPGVVLDPDEPGNAWDGSVVCVMPPDDFDLIDDHTAQHIASWHPAVALAVADWLEGIADAIGNPDAPDCGVTTNREERHAIAVARAYMEGQP